MATRIANCGPKRPPRALPIWSWTHVLTVSSNFLGFWGPGASILRARGVPKGARDALKINGGLQTPSKNTSIFQTNFRSVFDHPEGPALHLTQKTRREDPIGVLGKLFRGSVLDFEGCAVDSNSASPFPFMRLRFVRHQPGRGTVIQLQDLRQWQPDRLQAWQYVCD